MYPILQVGPLAVQLPGLLLLAGLWLGLNLAERHSPRFGIPGNLLYSMVFAALFAGLVTGRLAYAFRFPQAFLSSPLSLLSPTPQMFDLPSAVVGAGLVAWVYAARRGMSFWNTLDALTPLIAVLAVALGFAHISSGSAFGSPANLPWSVELWGERRHPSQIYETILAAVNLLITLRLARKNIQPRGSLFLSFTALSATARLFLEAFRGDSLLIFGGLRAAQLAAWLVLAASLILLGLRSRSDPVIYATGEEAK